MSSSLANERWTKGRQIALQVTHESRTALFRARFFLAKADLCTADERQEFEAFLEAALIFGRTALLRVEAKYEGHAQWKPWWTVVKANPEIEYFRTERNWIIHEAPPRLGQKIVLGDRHVPFLAGEFYYFKDSDTPAVLSTSKYLDVLNKVIADAESRFSRPTQESPNR